MAQLWNIGLMEPTAVEDVLAVDGVPILSSFGVRKGIVKNGILQTGEPDKSFNADLEMGLLQQ